jgi:choline kinase
MKKVVRSKVNKYDVPAEIVRNQQREATVNLFISLYLYPEVMLGQILLS